MRTLSSKRAGAIGLGLLLVIASAEAGELRRWTRGTTEAANEVLGPRSGLSFHLADPPSERPDILPALHVTVAPRAGLAQIVDLSRIDPPEPDREARDPGVRLFVDPPEPDRPAFVIQLLHPEDVVVLGPDGERLTLGR